MLPIVEVPATVRQKLAAYRDLFCREAGFEHVSRYVTGLILSPNKTLQGIYDLQVWAGEQPSRRVMHEAVFEAGWEADRLMAHHRATVAPDHRGRGREVISLDWTLGHHERGPKIYGTTKSFDSVEWRPSRFQTLVTAVIANRQLIDGIEAVVQEPDLRAEEEAYLKATGKEAYTQMAEARQRLLELLHHYKHRLAYKKRTEIVVEVVAELEQEGHFPQAQYAFDKGVLALGLTQLVESKGTHWASELERSRNIQWYGQWRQMGDVAAELRQAHPESFRPVRVRCRNGETKVFWAFTKVVRLHRYGRKRIVIVHEREDLADAPQLLITDALHRESGRSMEAWSFRWTAELFHEFGKQATGLEAAQGRKEEPVNRHLRLSCIAQSLLQRAPAVASESEKFEFAKGEITFGQRCRTITREVFRALLAMTQRLFADGRSCEQVLEILMPA